MLLVQGRYLTAILYLVHYTFCQSISGDYLIGNVNYRFKYIGSSIKDPKNSIPGIFGESDDNEALLWTFNPVTNNKHTIKHTHLKKFLSVVGGKIVLHSNEYKWDIENSVGNEYTISSAEKLYLTIKRANNKFTLELSEKINSDDQKWLTSSPEWI
jgi:hypothetical protein